MPRSAAPPLALLLALPLALAGCLEGGSPPAEGGSPPTGVTPPSPIDKPFAEPVRTVDRGHQAEEREYATHVITSEAAWKRWYPEEQQDCGAYDCEGPQVDWSTERVLVAVLGPRPNACFGVEIAEVETDTAAGRTTATVVEHQPSADAVCAQVQTTPWHAVAVPKRSTEVVFVRE